MASGSEGGGVAGSPGGSGTASGGGPAGQGGNGSGPAGNGSGNGGSSAAARACAAKAYGRLSEVQRAGQLFMVAMPAQGGPGAEVSGAIREHAFGSVLFVGNTSAGVRQVRAMTDAVQRLSTPGIRLFVAANQEGGQIQPLKGPGFATIPSATQQGTEAPGTLRSQAAVWGRELKTAGVNLNLAPVMDTVPAGTAAGNAPIGALQRQFGDTPGTVATHGVAFIDGMRAAGVATSIKHFPGLGRVRGNTDFTADVNDTVTAVGDPYLAPYQAGINAGVPFVMIALARYTRLDGAHLAAFSTRILTGLLRQRMHFAGVIVSDDMAAAAVAAIPVADRAIAFLNVGGDMIIESSDSQASTMATAVVRHAAADQGFRDRVGTAVKEILAAKAAYGLIGCS